MCQRHISRRMEFDPAAASEPFVDLLRENHAQPRGHGQVVLALSELEACVPSETTVEQTIEENELAAAIDRFLYAKPKLNRNIFVRRYYHLYAIRDIADAYGMSESKVTSLLFRMRNELRRFLEKEGIML